MRRRLILGTALCLSACGGAVEDPSTTSQPAAPPPAGSDVSPPSDSPASAAGSSSSSSSSSSSAPASPARPASPSDLVAAHPAPPGMECVVDVFSRPGITGGRIYWPLDCAGKDGSRRSLVASAPVTGGPATVAFDIAARFSHELGPFSVNAHVVFQPGGSSIFFVKAGATQAMTLPWSGDQCVSVASDVANIYCMTNAIEQKILSWPIDSYVGVGPTAMFEGIKQSCGSLVIDGGNVYFACSDGVYRYALADAKKKDIAPTKLYPVSSPMNGFSVRNASVAWTEDGTDRHMPLVDDPSPDVVWFMKGLGAKRAIERRAPDGTFTTAVAGVDRWTRFTVDATHLYWVDATGVHRRAKP